MKFTLKDYQDEAVRDVLVSLRMAREDWRGKHTRKSAFSLTAATGAGKTVMAAAVFEALFHGDDNYDFDADPGAVVIWFSDDPSLNEQTRFRLMESSDRLRHTDLVVVENTFNRERFEAGKIHFLNTQKLGSKSLLVRGFEGDKDGGLFPETRPDMRAHTIWDTIRNTIEDPALTLYLVLDEAHRGMGNSGPAVQNERTTLVKRLINGEKGVPGIPVVLGISATVDRFNKAMEAAQGRTRLPDIKVDAVRVQDSGLLKDTIVLDIPDEAGKFDTVLVRRATDKLRESTTEWAAYAKQQENAETVLPLMVLQVPNKPNPDQIGGALDTIFQQWPDLPETSVAHVFGDHTTQKFGRHSVPYISPETEADYFVINDAYRRAARILSPDIARTYTEVLAKRKPGAEDDFEGALIEAREDIAALGLMENLQVFFDAEATKESDAWLAKYRDRIKRLPDDRQEAYRQISALSREAQDIDLVNPVAWMEATAVREADGRETQLPVHKQHLLCDEKGLYPAALETWESKVLELEMRRPGFKFWYRNPGRPSQDSLGVAYVMGDEVSIVRPDFLFFGESKNGSVVVDIVDPHGTHLADALPKLRGLASYAETHPGVYRRIEAVAESGGRMRVLDLTRADVRKAVTEASDAKSLYEGALAGDYK